MLTKQSEVEIVIQDDDTNFQVDERAGTSTFSILQIKHNW